jgi:hypothetical protein
MEAQLSSRAQKALEVLKAGGKFRKALETQFKGGEKFAMRLRDARPDRKGCWFPDVLRTG